MGMEKECEVREGCGTTTSSAEGVAMGMMEILEGCGTTTNNTEGVAVGRPKEIEVLVRCGTSTSSTEGVAMGMVGCGTTPRSVLKMQERVMDGAVGTGFRRRRRKRTAT